MPSNTRYADEQLAERIEAIKDQLAERIEAASDQAEQYRRQVSPPQIVPSGGCINFATSSSPVKMPPANPWSV